MSPTQPTYPWFGFLGAVKAGDDGVAVLQIDVKRQAGVQVQVADDRGELVDHGRPERGHLGLAALPALHHVDPSPRGRELRPALAALALDGQAHLLEVEGGGALLQLQVLQADLRPPALGLRQHGLDLVPTGLPAAVAVVAAFPFLVAARLFFLLLLAVVVVAAGVFVVVLAS